MHREDRLAVLCRVAVECITITWRISSKRSNQHQMVIQVHFNLNCDLLDYLNYKTVSMSAMVSLRYVGREGNRNSLSNVENVQPFALTVASRQTKTIRTKNRFFIFHANFLIILPSTNKTHSNLLIGRFE